MHKTYAILRPEDLTGRPYELSVLSGLAGNHEPWARGLIGAWRWSIVQKYAQTILDVVNLGYVVDLGGAAGPIGYNAIVVDYDSPLKSLVDLPGTVNAIFSSHTIEHVKDLRLLSIMFREKLDVGGIAIVIVPSYKCERLRAGNWPFHEHTFCLNKDEDQPAAYVRLESFFEGWADIKVADELDGNLIVIAQKPGPQQERE